MKFYHIDTGSGQVLTGYRINASGKSGTKFSFSFGDASKALRYHEEMGKAVLAYLHAACDYMVDNGWSLVVGGEL